MRWWATTQMDLQTFSTRLWKQDITRDFPVAGIWATEYEYFKMNRIILIYNFSIQMVPCYSLCGESEILEQCRAVGDEYRRGKSLWIAMEIAAMQKTAVSSGNCKGGDQWPPGGLKLQIKSHKEEAAVILNQPQQEQQSLWLPSRLLKYPM